MISAYHYDTTMLLLLLLLCCCCCIYTDWIGFLSINPEISWSYPHMMRGSCTFCLFCPPPLFCFHAAKSLQTPVPPIPKCDEAAVGTNSHGDAIF